jgi:hypothetical protein
MSIDRVYLNATLAFNWTAGRVMNHPIAIEWLTAPQAVTYNKYTTISNSTTNANGAWRSGTGNIANATMIIGGSGPHPSKYNSTWACVGVSSPQPLTPLAASAFSSATIFSGQTWYFFAHSTGGVGQCTYQWYEGSALLSGQTSMLLPMTRTTPGTYTFYCKVTDALGSTTNSNTVTLAVI